VKKTEIVLRLLKAIESPLSKVLGGVCSRAITTAGEYIRALKACGLWPFADMFQQLSISTVLARMLLFQEPQVDPCSQWSCTACRKLNFREALRSGQEGILKTKMGLCLDCIQTDGKSAQEKKCRISHIVE
jgi:hypothetical protein